MKGYLEVEHFKTHKELIDFVNSTEIDFMQIILNQDSLVWYLFYSLKKKKY